MIAVGGFGGGFPPGGGGGICVCEAVVYGVCCDPVCVPPFGGCGGIDRLGTVVGFLGVEVSAEVLVEACVLGRSAVLLEGSWVASGAGSHCFPLLVVVGNDPGSPKVGVEVPKIELVCGV
jgi:hypothetical protein